MVSRIVWFDLDSLRPDHLGCYGYHRPTSPHIDRIARQGVRFDNCYTSDSPCLPSRAALSTCQCGRRNGVVAQGGEAADMPPEGVDRGGQPRLARGNWIWPLRDAGFHTGSISCFPWRHGAWWWTANFKEMLDSDGGGIDRADVVGPMAIDFIDRQPDDRPWFLHVNFWDPHTPYNIPEDFGDPFAEHPLPDWYTPELLAEHRERPGFLSPQDLGMIFGEPDPRWPRHPVTMDGMGDVRRMFDGYDTGIAFADLWLGRVVDHLEQRGLLDDTAIVITGDHGECLGEMNVHMDHQTADHVINRVPLIVRWPGKTDHLAGSVDRSLRYQFDFAATMSQWIGKEPMDHWDARGFAQDLEPGAAPSRGRPELILSHGAWSYQRSVRFDYDGASYVCVHTLDDAFHGFPEIMLFDVENDPHQLRDLARERPLVVDAAMAKLAQWRAEMDRVAEVPADPMLIALREGAPMYVRPHGRDYVQRLRDTARGHWIETLANATRAETGSTD